ncbi:MAG TPA: magnesium transporter [Candidatus Fermentibacter daniensis]|jgi:magnesium transporter|nr:MAG: magnesium transporter [Candidatus Fermentibacter daniensis]MBP7719655.1 magnesium transporter [Candidatus Fermentibacter sp.]KZD18256.1 MAG: magnesium transporter [Candidatus Fermentibacter daniensis]KZD19035.1 MAG: magnesium transporter [Candidatus Fermentibacter daniensis]HOA04550.1 magnesium transporter [Candidatus Fermentibacter daniensis]
MKNKDLLLVPDLREMLAADDSEALRSFCESGHPAVIAEFISDMSGQEAWTVLLHAVPALRSEIFSHLDEDLQVEIIGSLRREEVARLLAEMSPDDRADLFKQLPEDLRESVLPALAQAEREDIRRLSSYSEGTAGAVMTSDYASLAPHLTAFQAIERLREVAPDKETIYYAYVVDDRRKLLGFVSLKDLIIARREARVSDIMHGEVIFSRVEDDQEDAARKIQKYDLIALPVLDGDDALVGIITYDDAIDVITQEHTEDMEKFMAIAGSHEAGVYLKTSAWVHFKNRAYWIVGLAALGLVSGVIIHRFEATLMKLLILALYMPMLADTGGNTGSQSATVVVRALALGEITPRDVARVLFKEFKISVLLAVILGVISWGKVMFLSQGAEIPAGFSLARIGGAIAIALGLQVVTATLIGALLPLGAARMKWDPAVVASPALTTIVDITGLLIYFTTARLLLGV